MSVWFTQAASANSPRMSRRSSCGIRSSGSSGRVPSGVMPPIESPGMKPAHADAVRAIRLSCRSSEQRIDLARSVALGGESLARHVHDVILGNVVSGREQQALTTSRHRSRPRLTQRIELEEDTCLLLRRAAEARAPRRSSSSDHRPPPPVARRAVRPGPLRISSGDSCRDALRFVNHVESGTSRAG